MPAPAIAVSFGTGARRRAFALRRAVARGAATAIIAADTRGSLGAAFARRGTGTINGIAFGVHGNLLGLVS